MSRNQILDMLQRQVAQEERGAALAMTGGVRAKKARPKKTRGGMESGGMYSGGMMPPALAEYRAFREANRGLSRMQMSDAWKKHKAHSLGGVRSRGRARGGSAAARFLAAARGRGLMGGQERKTSLRAMMEKMSLL